MILNLQYALPQILLYMCPASKMVTKFANLIKKIILKMFKTMVFFQKTTGATPWMLLLKF